MDEPKAERSEDTESGGTKRKAEWVEIEDERNRCVYVSGLPADITEEDFIELMKKYGIIAKKLVKGSPFNIKLYKNPDGTVKGDATCCYARVESVELAIEYLEGYLYNGKHTLHCERAKFQMKGDKFDPDKKPRKLDKKTITKLKKAEDKLLSWDAKPAPAEAKQKKVILKNMFTPDEITQDATKLLDLKEDVEDICSEMGFEPTKVEIRDKHPDGVIEVTFKETSQAESCVKSLDGQYYAGRTAKAELWDGRTKYKIKETDEETEERLKKWHEDLEKPDQSS